MRLGWFVILAAAVYGQSLNGVIDIHAHSGPDSTARSIDAIDLAKLAKARGMRGLVLKNHYESTAALAYVVRQVVPGIEIFGGIDLNLTVGGINPAAVERMTMMKGGWGRVVWMPTFDAENQVRDSKENRPYVSVSRNGQLLPEVRETIAIIARHHLVLATGHSTPDECLLLVREGRRAGVEHMVITHAMKPPVRMNIGHMKQAAAEGAFLEFDYGALTGREKIFERLVPKGFIFSSTAGNPFTGKVGTRRPHTICVLTDQQMGRRHNPRFLEKRTQYHEPSIKA